MTQQGQFRFDSIPAGEYVLGVNIRGENNCHMPQILYSAGIQLREGELLEGSHLI